VQDFFTSPKNSSCFVSEWYASKDGEDRRLTLDDALANRLKLFPTVLVDDMKINTFLDGEADLTISFFIYGYSGLGEYKVKL
jgi:hypothetical protein